MASISLRGVSAKYELLSVVDYNLKHRVIQTLRRRKQPPAVIEALYGVDVDLQAGARVAVIGPNGAGKSTLLAVMAGLLPPTGGEVHVNGRVLALLGASGAGLAQEATGLDNIVGVGVQLGETPAAMRRRVDDIVDFSDLQGRIAHPVYSYSAGMQARLRFSILTSLRPDILLLDEGLGTADAAFAAKASRRMRDFVSQAGLMLLASHSEDLLKDQCTTGLYLARGRIAGEGPLASVLAAYQHDYSTELPDGAPT